ESVDSEMFDVAAHDFQGTSKDGPHNVSSPFELSHYPIEVQESRKLQTKQLNDRVKLESVCEPALGSSPVDHEPRCLSPQVVEMHTFRDAIDVNYQRMAITGEELSGVPLEDLHMAATHLAEALRLRKEYMDRIGNQFPSTTRNFIDGSYPENLPRMRRKNTESTEQTPFDPPKAAADHWGLKNPLPVPEKIYKMWRKDGVVCVGEKEGEVLPAVGASLVSKEEFLRDTEKLTQMIVDGPLKSFCFRRLAYLQNKFQLHVLLNEIRELHEQKAVSHRDFYNIRKVDTHIHAASSMNQKHLLRFIKKKMKTEESTVVLEKMPSFLTDELISSSKSHLSRSQSQHEGEDPTNGKPVTMKEVLRANGNIGIRSLGGHARCARRQEHLPSIRQVQHQVQSRGRVYPP
ncbi:hypothetical protein PENTCL1PPCAC_30321, partial [Pristionchus entomophagus]